MKIYINHTLILFSILLAIKSFSQSIEAENYFNLGISEMKMNNPNNINSFSKAIELDSLNAKYYFFRAKCYQISKQYNETQEDFEKSIKLVGSKDLSDYLCTYADWLQLFNPEKSKILYSKAIENDPMYSIAYAGLGKLAFKKLDYYLTIHYYNKAIQFSIFKPDFLISSRSEESWLNYAKKLVASWYEGRGEAKLNLEMYDISFKDLDTSILLFPNELRNYYLRGRANASLKKTVQAINDFSKFINEHWGVQNEIQKIEFSHSLGARGLQYRLINEKEKSCLDFERACELGDCELRDDFCRTIQTEKLIYNFNYFSFQFNELEMKSTPIQIENKFEIDLIKGGKIKHYQKSGAIMMFTIISDIESGNDLNLNKFHIFYAESEEKEKVKFQIYNDKFIGIKIYGLAYVNHFLCK